MDMTTAFRSEVFRPLVTIVIPGTIAALPYVIALNNEFPDLSKYRENHEAAYYTVVALLTVGLGMLINDAGTYIEDRLDKALIKDFPTAVSDWYEYLNHDATKQTIGHNYLRAALLHLRFEIALLIALPIFFVGILFLEYRTCWLGSNFVSVMGAICLGLTILLFLFARTTVRLLAKVRANIVRPIQNNAVC
jgi:hypothetical protein